LTDNFIKLIYPIDLFGKFNDSIIEA